jgi:transposase-like protein
MPAHRKFSPEFKAKLVLEVISGTKTAADVCREHNLKPDLLSKWKATFLANAATVFQSADAVDPAQARVAELERLAGRLSLELEVAKKASQFLSAPPSRNTR